MAENRYYSITTKRFVLRCKHDSWLRTTQELYNDILLFYYQIYLEREDIRELKGMQVFRTLEMLTVVGRDRQPVPYPLKWKGVPLYFRRAAINAAIAAGKSYLARGVQEHPAESFEKAVTYYKGMYRNFGEDEIILRVWNSQEWQWMRCRIAGNYFPPDAERLSPSVVIREKMIQLHAPVREKVMDGRKARERMHSQSRICALQFTNSNCAVLCVIMDHQGNQVAVHFIKGGSQYAHNYRRIEEKIDRAQKAMGYQNLDPKARPQEWPNKKYWIKLKNLSDYFSNSVSRQVINYIIEYRADIIVVPKYDREYTRIIMATVHNCSPLRLMRRIREQLTYKAWRQGILVLDVNASNTSSVCAKCGGPIRKHGDQFQCPNGHRGNRYINTALNLGRKCLESFSKHMP